MGVVAIFGCALLVACGDDGGTPDAATDTGVADTSVADSGVVDSSVDDTGAGDTSAGDTGAGDTGAGDTGAGDTGAADAALAPVIDSVFDEADGAVTYVGGLDPGNWTDVTITPHAGVEVLASGNGSSSTFVGLGITKDLGGVIEDRTYEVSFYIAIDEDIMGVELSDFSVLEIGGPGGGVTWTDTPTPTVDGEWLQWRGTYTPMAADVGEPFAFRTVFDLDPNHTIAIDGPVVVRPVP
jgi:hypothetical protein